jgi:DhnA family fructose-bisphosphate aldolase class Ia
MADVLSNVDDLMAAGVAGLAMGRNVFEAADPAEAARLISARIHARPPVAGADAASGQEVLARA